MLVDPQVDIGCLASSARISRSASSAPAEAENACSIASSTSPPVIRLLRAMEGVALCVTPVAGAGSGKLQLEFGHGVMVTIAGMGPGAGRDARAKAAARCSSLLSGT